MSIPKNSIVPNTEKFLKKEIETATHNDDKMTKIKTALKYLAEDDCFVIFDPECSIRCVFEEGVFNRELEKKGNKQSLDSQLVIIKKSHLDVLFSLDINGNYLLKVVLYVEDFEVDGEFKSSKELPININLFPQIQALLKDVHTSYLKRKLTENKFLEGDKINASNFSSKKFESQVQNILSLRVEASNFLLRQKIVVKNFHSYTHDEKPEPQDILKALKNLDAKKLILKQPNCKENKVKELKPSKVDLSKIPSSNMDDENVDEEYRVYLKQTTLSNPVSNLSKDMYLKHKRRRTSIAKPNKAPLNIQNLYNEYQNIFANVKLSTVNKYCNMQKYKETISN